MIIKCLTCKRKEFWQLNDRRLKCKRCRLVFTPKSYPFGIKPAILSKIIEEFLLEHSTNIILARVKISKYKLLKILTFLQPEQIGKSLVFVTPSSSGMANAYVKGQKKLFKQFKTFVEVR